MLGGPLDYDAELFDATTAERLLAHLTRLLEGAAERPETRLSELPLLTPAEHNQIVVEWNDTRDTLAAGARLQDLFEARVRRTPEAVALVHEGGELRYGELNARANRLAHLLRRRGVGPDALVGLCFERSPEMIVGLLGVLKAGGAYVPLDPSLPQERLAWMIEDAGLQIVVSRSASTALLPDRPWKVLLDSDLALLETLPAEDPVPLGDGESLAYVIYTSGSTGRPKGVQVSHGNVVRLFAATQPWFSFTEHDVWTLFHSYAFDFSVWEIWGALLHGGRLVVVPYEVSRTPELFLDLLVRERITVLNQTPSAFAQLARADEERGGASTDLRLVIFGGEALDPASLAPWIARHGDKSPRLVNMYGITETTVHVTYRPVRAADARAERRSAIGRPIPDLSLLTLDPGLRPVPIGVPGELAVGGAGLARGYLNRPELTAERFVPDPFSGRPGARLYRSGDLGRFLSDGDIEYLGRIDHQVKIRGFRIELGEIEAALSTLAGVREAVVVAREEGGDRRLAAYVTGEQIAAEELRQALRERLPDYMVPAAFVVLDALPLTPNGKVDRKALPAPGAAAAREYVAPRSPLEQVVAGIWAELLKVERVGLEDNFFDLGGDSIKAVRLVSRVNERLGADLRVQDVFKHQTVEPLAQRIATRSGWSQADDLAAGRAEIERLQRSVLADERQRAKLPEDYEDFFPLSGVEKGMVYYTLLLPEQPIYHDQHIYVLSIPDLDRFDRALVLVMGRHPILRSTFHLDAFEEPMKVVLRSVPVVRDVEDLSGLPAAEQRERIERYRAEDLRHKFTFRGEVLWRLKLFRLEADTFVTVWTWHHAILDGWSNLTFWLDLNELLARENLDRIESLAPLASSYKDYLAITLGRRRSPATEAFWRATLASAGRNKLPFHRAVTRERAAFGMRSLHRPLRRELLLGLRERAAELHLPLQALFLAAHLHLLRVTSGEEDVITGVVSHDRPGIPNGDKIVGCFLNTFPLRLRLEPGETGASLARRVARFLATEKEHEIPLVDIASIVGARESAQNPIFDTLLNFMDFHLIEEVRENVLFRPMTGQDSGQTPRELPDLRSDEMTNTLFDLEVSATPGNPFLRLKYLPRHFEAADVERALALYDRILETLAGDLDAPLATQALLSEEEHGQLVAAYNDTALDYPRERPLHSFFEEQAARAPGRLAVQVGGSSLTYGELDRLANRVARLLLARGVQLGDNVGVCLERSPELVAALFGVLKAGAAFVPLEPSYPPARKDYITRQSAISFLLDRLPEDLAAFSEIPVPVRPRPDDLAYTIYTSGSTGTPKGVMIEHHSAVNLIGWVNREMAVGPEDRVLMVSSICFDLSVYDVFGTLATGGTVVVARQEEVQEPAALLRLLVERGITFWNSVPSTLGLLVQYLEEADPGFRGEDLRLAFLSGDWIPLSLPERARRFFPHLRVISLGGATEATVWSIFHPVERIDETWLSIPYGRPLDNNTFYVLDRHLELVPPGVVGDLYIGGVGVARGYAGDPEKTAASYLPDPFGDPGGRLYRTGDLGRMLPESEIELLGRNDHQVKVRGFRIELGEIESQLNRAPGVREAVVLARTDRAGQKYLCGYVVASDEVSIGSLQAYLAGSLPGYMIPDTFVFLSELPLSANGKIDRKALPEPEVAHTASGTAHVAAANATEAALVEIWEEVLGLSGIGTAHDFFALGGHSLSAIQVLTRVRRRFEIDLPLPDFFDNPTVAGLAAVVERLLGTGVERPPLGPGKRPERLPLSFAQERLWFLDRLGGRTLAYNESAAFRMEGSLDTAALRWSLDELLCRHESLRTTFPEVDDQAVQSIQPPAPFEIPKVDLRGLPRELRDEEARRLASAQALRPFDLDRGPLVRGLLVRFEDHDHVALFSFHHIVFDGWSIGIFARELSALYGARIAGRPSPLPPLAIQYADFAAWQRQWLRDEVLDLQLAWWRERLEEVSVLALPTDRPRPAFPRAVAGQRALVLSPALTRKLRELGQRRGTTLFMTLLAAFQALLHRSTAQDDIAVGSPIANRNRSEIEPLIGFFVNMLVLRTGLSGDPTFVELLERVRQTALGAYAHQDLPFEKLVDELRPARSLHYTPLFQVSFQVVNAPVSPLKLPGLTVQPFPFAVRAAKFDLDLGITDYGEVLGGPLDYDAELFDATTAERLLAHLTRLLEGAAERPETRLSELPLLTPAEHSQIVVEWNDTRDTLAAGARLQDLFETQVRRTPEAVALVHEGGELSYGELNARANRLAHLLRRRGVGPDALVGLCFERSPEMIVGLLGVLKAGGAYVPLDPSLPQERLAWMIEDAGLQIVVANGASAAVLPDAPRKVLLDSDLALLETLPAEDPVPLGDGESLAYVIYTSGSTGRPKGVQVSHGNVARLFAATQPWFGFTERDVWTLFHSFAFDFSVWEIWGTLLYGGRLVVVPYEVSRTPALFLDLLVRERVTVLNQTPSAFAQLARVDQERGGASTDLRLVLFGGEALDPAGLGPWIARHGDESPRLVNMYGITETTVHVTYRPLHAADARAERRSAIGRPIPDLSLLVLDPGLWPAPIGVPGELAVGGAGLARGYLGRPDLTAERFVPDPFSSHPGARLYRSGDLGRFLPDGDIEYLGRIDHQVKIRGFRIELGEIEAALSTLAGVREAVAAVRENAPGDRRLVAYVTGDATAEEMRRSLRERLPDYMIPAAFVTLAALPLTPNGKVDRKALPAPEQPGAGEGDLAPWTPVEEVLAGIWAEVLGLERVGAAGHFFNLGGHSLLATRLVAAIRDAFQVDFPVRLVFEHPVLAGMARAISAAGEAGAPVDDPVGAIPREPGVNRFPVSFSQLREWILDRLEPGNPAYNIPSPLRIEGPLAMSVLTAALRGLVRRHEVFRTRFAAGSEEGKPEPLQIVLPDVLLEVPVIDLSALPESVRDRELRGQAVHEARTGFDLSVAPLLRTRVVRLAPEDHALLLTVHHIISDGWSMGILHQEVAALYEAAAQTSSPSLPPLPVQYADYAVWQRRRLDGDLLERQAGFWRQRLAGAPPLLELPTDRPRPPVRGSRGGMAPFHLPQPLAGRLQELARRRGATLFMVLLAGYQTLLGRWSGQDDIVVGTYSGNRPKRELEGLIGFFINTLVLRTGLAGDPSFAALLGRAREAALGAYAHADIPFEKLLEILQLPRDPSRTPLFQAHLVLQNFPPTQAGLSTGVRLSSLQVASEKVDYDLELWLGEGPDGIAGSFRYSASLFDEATIARFAAQLRTLLEAAAADPEQTIWALPLVAEEEQALQLQTWSRGPAIPAGPPLLHRLVEEQAARTPGAVALEAGGLRLTYAELIERARPLARHLRAEGVGPGSIVALTTGRTPDLIVSMLAVLQAGAAYLPIDPAYPQERREYMVADSGAVDPHPLTPSPRGEGETDPVPAPPLPWERGLGGEGSGEAGFVPAPEFPAYVIYTSGSTGRPKGVVVPHRAIASFVRAARESYGLAPGDRVLQFAALGFDTSAEEIWPALASGATLVLRPDDMAESIPHFLRELGRLGITVLDLPTAFWHELVTGMEAENLELPGGLRLVILGGEEARADRFALWSRRVGSSVRLVNTYGPTEATVVATRRELAGLAPGGLVPIGRPIPGARVHVLDRLFTPVPPGVRGELWIGGAGVARGYLGRPDLTAERFVPDPFTDQPGARLYRTGDLAFLRPDGDLVFAGRADRQLKIRGYRIEPGEIEAALRLHPAVRDAVADARGAGDVQRLVAWIVPREGDEAPGASDLRAFLRDRLPEPLIPAVFVPVARLPLGPSGKVDRRALPEPPEARPDDGTYAAPQSALERTIAEIYRDLLQIDRIGVHDNFFDLGGHSMLIVRAHQRLKEALGRELPVLDLFRFPTVAALARHLGGEVTGTLQRVQGLAERQRAAQQRHKAAMERLHRPGGSVRK
nr:AMP-dependent synthetase and ligase [uncultured bacterium]